LDQFLLDSTPLKILRVTVPVAFTSFGAVLWTVHCWI